MTNALRAASLGVCLLAGGACQRVPDDASALLRGPTAVAREARLQAALAGDAERSTEPDESRTARGGALAVWLLPHALQEISGLALTTDGRLLAHGDEIGVVWEIDYRRGVLIKQFSLGKGVKGDFEGITVANDEVFLFTSTGKLYEFHEGGDGAHVEYTVHDTELKHECEFEGVAFDPAINALLLACKHVLSTEFRDAVVIYRWSLKGDSTRLSPIVVPIARIVGANGWKHVHPSDIAVDPMTGNYVLVASQEQALIAITPSGALVFARPLAAMHHQAEGVAITRDGMLIVSDEGAERPAMITLYKWP
jgi:uncharacterized protein YjiK